MEKVDVSPGVLRSNESKYAGGIDPRRSNNSTVLSMKVKNINPSGISKNLRCEFQSACLIVDRDEISIDTTK